VYFTDPAFRAPTPLPQGKTAVYYVDAAGKVTRLIDDLPNPNGVRLSPDEKTLYVFPTGQKTMMSYPVLSPGKIGPGKAIYDLTKMCASDVMYAMRPSRTHHFPPAGAYAHSSCCQELPYRNAMAGWDTRAPT